MKLVQALAPTASSIDKIAAAFGLDPVDYDGIRKTTKDNFIHSAEALQPALSETAMTIHMQRINGSFVSSAQFYQSRMSQARQLTSKLANDNRDEDREWIYGFESRAARFRQFAAEAAMTSYAVMAAAEGAVAAHLHVTGEEWKPSGATTMTQLSAAGLPTPSSPLSNEPARVGAARPPPFANLGTSGI